MAKEKLGEILDLGVKNHGGGMKVLKVKKSLF